tara:strand:+ start:2575 stop:2844 length:270 start_codon:yes stop_codon:yes gene_type:complete
LSLSHNQSRRLATLLAVMGREEIPETAAFDAKKNGYIRPFGEDFALTDKGLDEKNRLCTLAGLNIKYQSERTKKTPAVKQGFQVFKREK